MTNTAVRPQVRPATLVLLIAVLAMHSVDRQIIGVLAEPIKRDLALTDTQLGMLTGLFFTLFYVGVGLPLANFADRADRPKLLAWSIGAWSALTGLCGAATGFISMGLARAGVAIGESGCNPATQSLVADYYPPERRATVQGLLAMSTPIATLVALALGGIVAQNWGWRAAFFVIAIPGLLLAPIVWRFLPEPRRTQDAVPARALATGVSELLRSGPLCWLIAAMSLAAVLQQAIILWVPALVMRSFGWSVAQAGIWVGIGISVGGVVGAIIAGRLADRLRTGKPGGQLKLLLALYSASVPLFVVMLLTDRAEIAVAMLIVVQVVNLASIPVVYAMLQDLATERTRALAFSLLMVAANVVGTGAGPVAIGALSDMLTPRFGQAGLGHALFICVITQVAAVLLVLKTYQKLRAAQAPGAEHAVQPR